MALEFFLGGRDLEMATIRALLDEHAPGRVHDRSLQWGARSSAYREEIEQALERGDTPVLIELEDDLDLTRRGAVLIVDHHGERAGDARPTALHQVFELLNLPLSKWTRWLELVALNDVSHIRGLERAGASRKEVEHVRAADRAAQGITPEEEAEGDRAVRHARRPLPQLTVVDLHHNRTATVADRLDTALGGPSADNLLILSPTEVNFFGDGAVAQSLHRRFGGWIGGSLPERGFWGYSGDLRDIESIVAADVPASHLAAARSAEHRS